jgi:hypothetical protein
MLHQKCVKLSIRIVPVFNNDFYFKPVDEYEYGSYKHTINKYMLGYFFNDIEDRSAVKDIIEFVNSDEFPEIYDFKTKAGIVFFHNGFPLVCLKNKLATLSPNMYCNFILVDINNYIFNKSLVNYNQKNKQYREKQDKEIIMILIVLGIIYSLMFLYREVPFAE